MITLDQSQLDSIIQAINNRARLDSPELIGTPTAPTAAAGVSNKQIATTEFVMNNSLSGGGPDSTKLKALEKKIKMMNLGI